jgi:hypothetical protein
LKESNRYEVDDNFELPIGTTKVRVSITAPKEVPRSLKEKVGALLNWMRTQGQTSLDYESMLMVPNCSVQCDKPTRAGKTISFVVTASCGGTEGYKTASTLYAMAQGKKKMDIKLLELPVKKAAKATKPPKAAEQPGDKGGKESPAKK